MQYRTPMGDRCDEHGTRAKTVVAELLRPWTLADRAFGHPAWKEYADGRVDAQPVELWPDQPADVPMRITHDPYAADVGRLVYLERRRDGGVWGVFDCRPGFALDGVAAVMRATPCCSIQVEGRPRPTALGATLLRGGDLVHVALVDRSAAGTRPAKEAIGSLTDEDVGAPKIFDDYEKALLRRAADHVRNRRPGTRLAIADEPGPTRSTSDRHMPIIDGDDADDDDGDIVGWYKGKVIRQSDAARHPAARQTRDGTRVTHHYFPNAKLTVR